MHSKIWSCLIWSYKFQCELCNESRVLIGQEKPRTGKMGIYSKSQGKEKKMGSHGKVRKNTIQYSDTIFFSLAKFESLSLTFLKIMFLIKLISVYFLLCVVLYFWTAKVFSNGSNQVKIPGKLWNSTLFQISFD